MASGRFTLRSELLSLIFLCCSITTNTCAQTKTAVTQSVCVESGDLIFRLGTSPWSEHFSRINPTVAYSHVGVILKVQNNVFVLHSDAGDYPYEGGVQKTPLAVFLADSIRCVAKKNLMDKSSKKAFLRALLAHVPKKTPFDLHFDLNDNAKKVYCTEYIWSASLEAKNTIGSKIHFLGREGISLESIFFSPLLGAETVLK